MSKNCCNFACKICKFEIIMGYTRLTAAEAAALIKNGEHIAMSGFTPAGVRLVASLKWQFSRVLLPDRVRMVTWQTPRLSSIVHLTPRTPTSVST